MKSVLQKSYNREAALFDEKFASLQRPKYEAFLNRSLPTLSGKVLDLGCGSGLFYEYLLSCGIPFPALTGIDFAEELCRLAGKRGMECLWGDAAELPFSDNSFEGVVSFTVIGILPEQDEAILREVFRVLKPGGFFWLSVLAKNCTPSLDALLEARGFRVQQSFSCGQDHGYICDLNPKS